MFKFEHQNYLYFLAAVPALAGLLAPFLFWRSWAMGRFGEADVVNRLIQGFSKKRIFLKTILFALGLAFLVIASGNPQRGAKTEKVAQQSADVFIALDISQSMLAEDLAPSRLERAKGFAQKLVQNLPGQRIGLIFFAGSAYLQMPLSTDYAAAVSFIRTASPELVSEQGTAIADAFKLAEQSFDPGIGGRAVVVITDGETHDEEAIEEAEALAEKGIQVHAIGVGTAEGAPIPAGLSINGSAYKRDQQGEIVKTKLNEKLLYELAQAGGGEQFNLSAGDSGIANAIRRAVDKLEKKEVEARSYTEFESYYQWFLLPGILLLAFEFLLAWRRERG